MDAPTPGNIVKILIDVGSVVTVDQPLVVMEARVVNKVGLDANPQNLPYSTSSLSRRSRFHVTQRSTLLDAAVDLLFNGIQVINVVQIVALVLYFSRKQTGS